MFLLLSHSRSQEYSVGLWICKPMSYVFSFTVERPPRARPPTELGRKILEYSTHEKIHGKNLKNTSPKGFHLSLTLCVYIVKRLIMNCADKPQNVHVSKASRNCAFMLVLFFVSVQTGGRSENVCLNMEKSETQKRNEKKWIENQLTPAGPCSYIYIHILPE